MEPIWSELTMERMAGRAAAQLLVESDIQLPAGREAQRLLFAQGKISNDAAHCTAGRVQAEGKLSLQLLLLDRENKPFGVRASTQYGHEIAMSDVKEGMRAAVRPQLLDLRCTLKDRRVQLNAVAELSAMAEQKEQLRVLNDVAGVNDIQKQYTEQAVGEWRNVGGGLVRLHEEIPADSVRELLMADAVAQINSVLLEAGGAMTRGTLYVTALYTDNKGQLLHMNQQLGFEELVQVEMDARCTAIYVTPTVEDVSVTLSEREGYLSMDVTLSLQAGCIATTGMQVLSDAYDPGGSCKCRQQTVERVSPVRQCTQQNTVQESLRTPEGMPDALRPVYISARPTVLGVSDSDGQLAVEGLLITSIVYLSDEGQLIGFEEDVPFRMTLDAPYMADAEVHVRALEVRASGSGRALNCVYAIEASAMLREVLYIPLAVDIEEVEPISKPTGILVSYATPGDTFWSMGKRFGVTTDQIKGWNPDVSEPLADGCPLMILSGGR